MIESRLSMSDVAEAVLALFPVGLFILNAEGYFQTLNPAMAGWFPQATPAGQPIDVLVHAEDQARVRGALARALGADGTAHETCRLGAPREDVEWMELHLRVVREKERSARIVGACVPVPGDIHRTGRLVREEHLRLLLDHSSDIMTITTGDERILYMTPGALERVSGYTFEEYLQIPFIDYVHPDDLPGLLAQVQRWHEHPPEVAVATVRIRMKSGEYRWMEERTRSLMDETGEIRYLININRDVTAQKELEVALRARTEELALANAELARAARVKDEFLASMSHELRTPLTAILGLSEALQLGIGGGTLTDQQLEMIASLEDSGRHLLGLINDVLDLAKVEAGRLELEPSVVDVQDCCAAVVRMLHETAAQHDVRLYYTPSPAVTALTADARRLKQMLINLLGNAVKFTPPGGVVRLEVCGDADRGTVSFIVSDTGIGIAAEDQTRLFMPFTQLANGATGQFAGTGLGLSLVKRMAKLHGGTVAVESALGVGSRFTVTLPWSVTDQLESAEACIAPRAAVADGEGATILVAEDHETLIALLSSFLTERGYRVLVARNGYEVLAHALAHYPD